MSRVARFAALLSVVFFALLGSRTAWAHTPGLSRFDARLEADGTARALLVFERREASAIAAADRGADGADGGVEAAFRRFVDGGVILTLDDARCEGTLEGGSDVEGDGFALSIVFRCPAASAERGEARHALRADLLYIVELPAGHRTVAHLEREGSTVERMLSVDDRTIEIDLPAPHAAPSDTSSKASSATRFVSALRLGIVHVLLGWDHVLFLVALALGARRAKPLVFGASVFTVAHSLTLGAAALGIFAPSPRIVEPLIAASIALLGVDNASRTDPGTRGVIVFLAGLAHGLGFASALRGLALVRDALLPTLVGFNVGVELGQIAVLAIAFPIVARLRRSGEEASRPHLRRASIALAVVGGVVCVTRVLSA